MPRVKPTLAGGFRDYGPEDMIQRQAMIATIQSVFERFGYDPLETPLVERRAVLTGNDPNFRMHLFDTRIAGSRIVDDPEQAMALRFDLTVPLARFVAAHPDLPRPFKRYQRGDVLRGEKPQAGRFREFMQFDVDIVGSDQAIADAEIIAVMVETLRELVGIRFSVRFNNRKLLNGLPEYAGYDSSLQADVLRIIDKQPKVGRAAVLRELAKPPRAQSGTPDSEEGADQVEAAFGPGLSATAVEKVGAFLDLDGSTDQLLGQASDLFQGVRIAEEGLGELREIVIALRSMGVPEELWRFDLSIARGLAYYTGPVFEAFLEDLPEIGSVFGGGRYDDLVSRFMAGSFPATGVSVGIDRLFAALKQLGRITTKPTLTQALVTVMDRSAMADYLSMTGELRRAGVRTMVWLGMETGFKAQLAYATRQEIPVVVISGSNERHDGSVTIKDMARRRQTTVPRADLVRTVASILQTSDT
ncbi:MAG: histidine--tRNA ligase [Candidatus Kerfeldbacteria bacterium]|nr:histidine--tRNA ligase [Candidatus Kerfeldbacteria bacterium]